MKTESTAIYAGSFDPFTIGHANIVSRAAAIFQNVVIAIGDNIEKHGTSTVEDRLKTIKKLYQDNPDISIVAYKGLTTRMANEYPHPILIRGARSAYEFEKEMSLADVNRMLSGIETLILPAIPELACISSSMVRELKHNNEDISAYLP